MGPNESQLRAALRDGEGESPDAGSLIFHAQRVRRERRRRISSIATGVAVVCLVVGGVTALVNSGRDDHAGSSNGGGGYAAGSAGSAVRQGNAKAPAAVGSGASASARAEQLLANAEATVLHCPTSASHYMLPGGGGINDFGSDSKLFAGQVVALKLCGYPSVASAPRTKVLDGSAATQLVSQLESAPSVAGGGGKCTETPVNGKVEILAVTTQHKAIKPVVLTLGCPTSQATNGTAVRYVHGLPDVITALLH